LIEPFIIGLFAGLGMGLKYTGTYKNTKVSKILFRIPLKKNKVFHMHHWMFSLIMVVIMVGLIETEAVSKQDPLLLLAMGYFITYGTQGAFLQDAFRFIEKRSKILK